ncbi:MAG: prepilin-type N-terminal cleavage/methylation domain-containing protein [Planctomycetota bacterium]
MIRHARAFTLVELLVVIGIIALLVGILLPTLSRARASAQKTVCLANLRSGHQTLVLYANDHDLFVPLGYTRGWKQFNYVASRNTTFGGGFVEPDERPRWLGQLFVDGYLESGESWFCPSEQDPQIQQNTENNAWPPGNDASFRTRLGYGTLPVIDWPEGTSDEDEISPDANPLTLMPPEPMPKLTQHNGDAILGDLFHKPSQVRERHGDGINVAVGHGAARFIPTAVLEAVDVAGQTWLTVDEDRFDRDYNPLFLSDDPNDLDLWTALGREF